MRRLTNQELMALTMREKGATYREIGAALGLSPSRAAMIEHRAGRIQRSLDRKQGIRDVRELLICG